LTRAFAALPAPGPTAGDKVVLFSSEIAQAAKERFGLEQNLRHAIGRDELLLHFQPVVDLAATKVVGAEALLRWRHPERGLVPPAEFIPIIEESGMMEEFGMWVLNAACREARLWELAGLTGLKMAVNVSARQLRQDRLVRMLIHTLDRYGLDPAALELELTESAALVDDVETRDLLAELRAMGISLAIDDFGAGYSSLSNLRKLPFNKLKIDREFVAGVDADRDNHAICGALVELARGLEITVLAEGAETLQEVESLQGLGCSMFQGYFFSRPLPAADFARTVVDPEWLSLLASPVHRHIATLNRRVAR
jgi:EAL domain-containing protein (putative c-di-GMP-specific phosphodiesterase class I)